MNEYHVSLWMTGGGFYCGDVRAKSTLHALRIFRSNKNINVLRAEALNLTLKEVRR